MRCTFRTVFYVNGSKERNGIVPIIGMVLGFILSITLCPQRHSKVCFELLETFWVTPKDLAINGCISLQS